MSLRVSSLLGLAFLAGLPTLAAADAPAMDAAATRAAFLKLIDRPRVPLAAEAKAPVAKDNLVRIDFSYDAAAGERVPGLILKSAASTGRRPVVIDLHGTGGNKEGDMAFLTSLANAGFVAVAIDAPFHGARTKAGKGSVEYVNAILATYRTGQGHPFFYDTVWDTMRLIDYLETRPDVDAKRIGLFGISKGGIETYLTAAVEPRVAVAVPSIGVESFRWATENNSWQSRVSTFQAAFDTAAKDAGVANPGGEFLHSFYARVAPGLDREFDGPAMVPLIAPRPLLSINGDSDPRTPIPGLNIAVNATKQAYAAAGAPEKFALYLQPNTGHKTTPEAFVRAQAWFVQWLKP
ncbi:MAG TPA: acetylxylan esterase [Opitutaceae bacterium]|nr:acetylxylan esterase [Opitutaceae bacterium]